MSEVNYTYEDFGTYDTIAFSLNKLPDMYNIQLDYIKFEEEKVKTVKSVATSITGNTLDEIKNRLDYLFLSGILDDYYIDLESSHIVNIETETIEETSFFVDNFSHYFEEE